MRFSMKNKKQMLSLCLAILLAMSLLLCAAVPTRAEGEETPVVTDVAEGTESVGEEDPAAWEPEVDPAETIPEETIPVGADEAMQQKIPEPAAFEEAKAVLLAVIDQNGAYVQAIEELLPEAPYLRTDFVLAMEKCTDAVSQMENLDIRLGQLEEKLQVSQLPEALQTEYWNVLVTEKAALYFDPMTELMEAVQAVKAGSQEMIFLYKTAAFQMETEALSRKANLLSEILDSYEYLVHTFDSDTSSVAAQKVQGMEAVLTRLDELTERRDQLKTEAESFFSLSEDDRASLPKRIGQLEEDTSAFLLSVKLMYNDRQASTRVEALKDDVSKAMILAVIGIGVAVIAIVIAIAAIVCAVRAASKEPEIDLSGTASSDDLKSLVDAFNSELNQIDLKAQSCQARQMDDIEARLKQLENRMGSPISDPPKPVSPVPEPPAKVMPKQVGSLRLKYQDVAPMNSSLIPDETGSLTLYEDLTVGLKPESQKLANDMKSWQSQGLLYLFNPQINGREYTAGQGTFPAGFYIIDHVERTARVYPVGSSYKLENKGCIVMKKV